MSSSLNGTGVTFSNGTTLSSAPVTSIATGNGLSGGTITTTGTLAVACPSSNSVGAYAFIYGVSGSYGDGTSAPGGNLNGRTGTWRAMGGTWTGAFWQGCSFGTTTMGLFCRIS